MGNATANADVAIAFFLSMGILFLVGGILVRTGISKLWFVAERVPGVVIPSFAHGLIPVGLGFIILGIMLNWKPRPEPEIARAVCCITVGPLFLMGMLFAVRDTWWIKPRWYRWLEEHHGDIIPLLQQEARAMGRWKWQRRVATQEGLEAWVAEVREKHGLG